MKDIEIACPKCACRYMPSELFNPKEFIGTANPVLRNEDGTIAVYDGNPMNLETSYICDKCSTRFQVKAKVSFTVKSAEDSFDTLYTTSVPTKLEMEED